MYDFLKDIKDELLKHILFISRYDQDIADRFKSMYDDIIENDTLNLLIDLYGACIIRLSKFGFYDR